MKIIKVLSAIMFIVIAAICGVICVFTWLPYRAHKSIRKFLITFDVFTNTVMYCNVLAAKGG